MKIKVLGIILFLLLAMGSLYAFNLARIVKPITTEKDIVLTRSLYAVSAAMERSESRLLYVAYVAGFLDAIQLAALDKDVSARFIQEYEGKNVGQISSALESYYAEHEESRYTPAATVLMTLIPTVKKN